MSFFVKPSRSESMGLSFPSLLSPLPRIFEFDAANPRHDIDHDRWSTHAKEAIQVREVFRGETYNWGAEFREGGSNHQIFNVAFV